VIRLRLPFQYRGKVPKEMAFADEGSKLEGHKSLISIKGIGTITSAILLSVIVSSRLRSRRQSRVSDGRAPPGTKLRRLAAASEHFSSAMDAGPGSLLARTSSLTPIAKSSMTRMGIHSV